MATTKKEQKYSDLPISKSKYINPFTDFGFKKLFGEEANKDILLDFINELLRKTGETIVSLTYLKTEQLGVSSDERKAIYDIYCENEKGEKFIIEIQRAKQTFFKDRLLYYSTFPIRAQAIRDQWTYELKSVYIIAILDFDFSESKKHPEKYRYNVKLTDIDDLEVFYDKFLMVCLVMPNFQKQVHELDNHFERWMYLIKNLSRLENLPEELKDKIFKRVFDVAEIAKFTPQEYNQYEESLKIYRDLKNSLDTAKEEGFVEGEQVGLEKGKIEGEQIGIEKGEQIGVKKMAKKLKNKGMAFDDISEITGLSIAEIEQL